MGIEPLPGSGHFFVRALDCAGVPVSGLSGTWGNLDLDSGEVGSSGTNVRYFDDGDPDQDATETGNDGLFAVYNLSDGVDLDYMVWGSPQDEDHCLRTGDGDLVVDLYNASRCLLLTRRLAAVGDALGIVELRPGPPAECQ